MTIQDLITAVEGAEAGSRELDSRVYAAVEGLAVKRMVMGGPRWAPGLVGMRTDKGDIGFHSIPLLTTSLDAAVALIKRKLPGWQWSAGNDWPDGRSWARVFSDRQDLDATNQCGNSAPLALCAALLRALQSPAQENRKDVS